MVYIERLRRDVDALVDRWLRECPRPDGVRRRMDHPMPAYELTDYASSGHVITGNGTHDGKNEGWLALLE